MGRGLPLGRAPPGDDEGQERMPPDLDRDVRSDEEERAAPERVRNRDRHHEAGEHDREHEQPDDDRVGIEHVRDPGGVVPGPPDDEQDEERPAGAAPGEVVEEQVRHLCDGEHEDEVVEELEVRSVPFLVGQALTEKPAHRRRTVPALVTAP